jgi:hypothetical protein
MLVDAIRKKTGIGRPHRSDLFIAGYAHGRRDTRALFIFAIEQYMYPTEVKPGFVHAFKYFLVSIYALSIL